jgi:hypothetical protein
MCLLAARLRALTKRGTVEARCANRDLSQRSANLHRKRHRATQLLRHPRRHPHPRQLRLLRPNDQQLIIITKDNASYHGVYSFRAYP